jgi:hypothetical protein
MTRSRVQHGGQWTGALPEIRFVLLDAEIQLARLNGKQKPIGLLKAQQREAQELLKIYEIMIGAGAAFTLEDFLGHLRAHQRHLQVSLELAEKPEKIDLWQKHLAIVKKFADIFESHCKVGRGALKELHRARFWQLDAEIQLQRLQGKRIPAKLLKERLQQAQEELKIYKTIMKVGAFDPGEQSYLIEAARILAGAALELDEPPQAKRLAVSQSLDLLKRWESIRRGEISAAGQGSENLYYIVYHRLDIEIKLLQLEKQVEKQKGS